MNYGFFIYGELDRGRLAAALAEMLSLPTESVDVGDEGDDDRNWDAPVSCTVTAVSGDLQWHLDIYVSKTVASPPPEPVAAAWVARRLQTVVAYQAVPYPPSAHWLVGPDGRRTRARIYDEDSGDGPAYHIDAVEHPVAALPGLRVAPLSEVIHSYQMPTPVADQLRERFQPQLANRDVAGRLFDLFAAWESMVVRLTEGWPPDGWYPAKYYREDLETRDELESAVDALPEPTRDEVTQALSEVDRRFAEATEDDGGQALTAEAGPMPAGAYDRWWWRRIPQPPPWRDTPGR